MVRTLNKHQGFFGQFKLLNKQKLNSTNIYAYIYLRRTARLVPYSRCVHLERSTYVWSHIFGAELGIDFFVFMEIQFIFSALGKNLIKVVIVENVCSALYRDEHKKTITYGYRDCSYMLHRKLFDN